MGHSEIECGSPTPRNDEGKLPYDRPLQALDERRRKMQSFADAASESFGSEAFSGPVHQKSSVGTEDGRRLKCPSSMKKMQEHAQQSAGMEEEEEVHQGESDNRHC